jgi:hypothetical protein
MRFYPKLLVLGALGGAAIFGASPGLVAAADEAPPPIEENYDYPNADQIFAERGIKLIKGDGHILFADCAANADQMRVRSRRWPGALGEFCFRVRGTRGFVTLELPETYLILGDSHAATAKVTVDGETEAVTIPKNTWVGVGEGENPNNGPATLLELRVAP